MASTDKRKKTEPETNKTTVNFVKVKPNQKPHVFLIQKKRTKNWSKVIFCQPQVSSEGGAVLSGL